MTPADPTLAAFVRQMRDHPADDTLRLVVADWFEERGESDRAEFVRVQVELARMGDDGGPVAHDIDGRCGCELCALRRRERELFHKSAADWLIYTPGAEQFVIHNTLTTGTTFGQSLHIEQDFRRGFVEAVACPAADWLAHGDAVCASHPVTKVTLATRPEVEEFAAETWHGQTTRRGWRLVGDPHAEWWTPHDSSVEFARIAMHDNPKTIAQHVCEARWPGVAFEMPQRRGRVVTVTLEDLFNDTTGRMLRPHG